MKNVFLTLSAHAQKGYSSHFVCQSLHFSILEKVPFAGLKLTSVYILGDDLSALNVALFLKSKLFWRKGEWNFGCNCSDVRGQRPVIKWFST